MLHRLSKIIMPVLTIKLLLWDTEMDSLPEIMPRTQSAYRSVSVSKTSNISQSAASKTWMTQKNSALSLAGPVLTDRCYWTHLPHLIRILNSCFKPWRTSSLDLNSQLVSKGAPSPGLTSVVQAHVRWRVNKCNSDSKKTSSGLWQQMASCLARTREVTSSGATMHKAFGRAMITACTPFGTFRPLTSWSQIFGTTLFSKHSSKRPASITPSWVVKPNSHAILTSLTST